MGVCPRPSWGQMALCGGSREDDEMASTITADGLYRTDDPALEVIATRQTLARWRCEGMGPPYVKRGGVVIYRGSDILDWLEEAVVRPGGGS